MNCSLYPKNLRCEYMNQPIGIDVAEPRLSWILESDEGDQYQLAYQILVATKPELLTRGIGDIWNTGRVESDETANIPYSGGRLLSGQRYYWTVRVWDSAGNPSEYAAVSFWEMGLLSLKDWKGDWVGLDIDRDESDIGFGRCKWIWDLQNDSDPGTVYFRRTIDLDAGSEIKRAIFLITADNAFSLWVNGSETARGASWRLLQHVDITYDLHPGRNVIAVRVKKDEHLAGLIGCLWIEKTDSSAIKVPTDNTWKVSRLGPKGWYTPDYDDANWDPAACISEYGASPWGFRHMPSPPRPAAYLRKTFELSETRKIVSAQLYATAKGVYCCSINGKKVGDDLFAPGCTFYDRRLSYQTYDVTELLNPGGNCLGAILGDGWYVGSISNDGREQYGEYPLEIKFQLNIRYDNGSRVSIFSDKTMKGSEGPIRYSDMQMGEIFDARMALPGWDEPGFNDSRWDGVSIFKQRDREPLLTAQVGPGVNVVEELTPIALTEPIPGTFIFDLGQNMVGRAVLQVPMGTEFRGRLVRLRFGEMLNADGTLYTENLRSARQTDTYILDGGGAETYEPYFTFHGFRYVEMTGYPGTPEADTIKAKVIHSALPRTLEFETSNAMVNKLQHNILWGQKANFLSIPTDCPQRDERLGWTGDAQIFSRTACYNMDVAAFYTKWLTDLRDSQKEDGQYPDVAPPTRVCGYGTAAWADAGVIIPWNVYQCYGDKRIIETNYDAMAKWVNYMVRTGSSFIRPESGFGDWLSIDAYTPRDLLATAYFAYSTKLLAKMARVIGRNKDADGYDDLFRNIKNAFNKEFVNDDGSVKGDTQTSYLLALHMDLLPDDKRSVAIEKLLDRLRERNWHLSTGFVGVSYLNPVLSEAGRDDLAYRLLMQDTYPSWFYPIKNGATTMWERWDSYTKERGFGDVGMNSFNHYAFGSIGEWLYRFVAGIDTDPNYPGFKRFIIRPLPGDGISWVKARFNSIRGPITVQWAVEEGVFNLDVTIPPNTSASVALPDGTINKISSGTASFSCEYIR